MTPVLEGLSWPVVAPARDHPRMLGDDLAFGANHDAFGVSPHTDRAVGERGRHAVAITLQGERLEAACQRAVASDSPSRKSVLSIPRAGARQGSPRPDRNSNSTAVFFEFTKITPQNQPPRPVLAYWCHQDDLKERGSKSTALGVDRPPFRYSAHVRSRLLDVCYLTFKSMAARQRRSDSPQSIDHALELVNRSQLRFLIRHHFHSLSPQHNMTLPSRASVISLTESTSNKPVTATKNCYSFSR